jgi:hypothetical protein
MGHIETRPEGRRVHDGETEEARERRNEKRRDLGETNQVIQGRMRD